MTHKSTGTVAELYLSNARGCESCSKCPPAREHGARSVTVPPKPSPPAPSPIRRLSTASQTYPVAAWPGSGSCTPVNPPRRTPRLPATESGGPRQTKRAARLGYRPNVSQHREAAAARHGERRSMRFSLRPCGGGAYNRIE